MAAQTKVIAVRFVLYGLTLIVGILIGMQFGADQQELKQDRAQNATLEELKEKDAEIELGNCYNKLCTLKRMRHD